MLAMKPEKLTRQIGIWGLWLLVINGMIGAGIFGVPAKAALLVGDLSPWIFVLCALLILPIMMCFAHLASFFNNTGGPVLYAGTAFGELAGFQAGWAFYVARITAFAANVNLLVATFAYFLPGADQGIWRVFALAIVCGGFTWLNCVGTKHAMRSLSWVTVIKLSLILALALYGVVAVEGLISLPRIDQPITQFGAAVILVFYAFVGFESSLIPGGEAKNPQRDLPRAIFLGLLVGAVLYTLIQFLFMSLPDHLHQSSRPLVDAADYLFGHAGAVTIMIAVIASVGANLMSTIFATPRTSYSLALNGQLPAPFAYVHPRWQTPVFSIAFFGAACFLLAVSGSFIWLAGLSVLTRLFLYALCVASIPGVHKQLGKSTGLYQLPAAHTLPVIALLVCAWLMWQAAARDFLVTAIFFVIGGLLFWIAKKSSRTD